jgi:GTP-binding protein HflX
LNEAQRGIVVAVDLGDPQRPLEPELNEFEALVAATGTSVLAAIVQRRDRIDPGTLIGSGKAAEIAGTVRDLRANVVLVLNELRPRQRKNLERVIPVAIVDRTMVILDVFARHARSREGKLQVELAQLRYRQSNLIGVGVDLSRLGGGIGTRGPGETKLEVDRRRIAQRISVLRRQLEQVREARATRRSSHAREPLVALVGYTNVGKSSLLNALARSNAFVADQPFATLDPTVRRVYLGPQRYVRLVDTVGFITDLPKDLVAAFRATLEELNEADLLVHVMDASSHDRERQRRSVDALLHELHLDEKPRLMVLNKMDLASEDLSHRDGRPIEVSAKTGFGLNELREAISERVTRNGGDGH